MVARSVRGFGKVCDCLQPSLRKCEREAQRKDTGQGWLKAAHVIHHLFLQIDSGGGGGGGVKRQCEEDARLMVMVVAWTDRVVLVWV